MEFSVIETWLGDGDLLEMHDTIPFKISAFAFVANGKIRSPSVMVSAVFGEFVFKFMLAGEFAISAKSQMFYDVGDFIEFGFAGVAQAGTKLKLRVHDAGVWDINEQTLGAGVQNNLFGGVFYRFFPFFLFWRCCFLFLRAALRC